MNELSIARLLIECEDRPGIVATVSSFLAKHGANITCLDQYSTDPQGGLFFMRLEFQTPQLDLSPQELPKAFARDVAAPFKMNWRIRYAAQKLKMAILVSKHNHALLEILWRWSRDELDVEIPMVISNHPELQEDVKRFNVPFFYVPTNPKDKTTSEAKIIELLQGKTDFVALARYMQILSPNFIAHFPNKIINIHHSFLPAFVGANPYRQAYDKGVKIIGATAHYVTQDLDMGPIIDQDIVHVSHQHGVAELTELGRNVERNVFARALKWHAEDRIIVHDNKTIVFA